LNNTLNRSGRRVIGRSALCAPFMPTAVIASRGLTWLGREPGILADGSTDLFDVYSAVVLWDGEPRSIEVEAANTQPLVGMNLLHRHSLHVEVVNGGPVQISSLP
jgi:predicted aspartyl protease